MKHYRKFVQNLADFIDLNSHISELIGVYIVNIECLISISNEGTVSIINYAVPRVQDLELKMER